MSKQKFKYNLSIMDGFQFPSVSVKNAFLKWVEGKFEKTGDMPTAEEILAEAKKKKSPIRGLFEWNDAVAAAQHRLIAAKYFHRSVYVEKVDFYSGTVVSRVRASCPVEFKGPKIVRSISGTRLPDNPGDVRLVMERMRYEFNSWLERYKSYANFTDVFDPLIKAWESVEKRINKTEFDVGGDEKKAG
jgi:hypothetical protein